MLILRPDHLGDVVLFSGALQWIRRHYPEAEITLCVRRYAFNFLEYCPYVDRLIPSEDMVCRFTQTPKMEWLENVRGGLRLQHLMRGAYRHLVRKRYGTDVILFPVRAPRRHLHCVVQSVPARKKYGISGDFLNQSPKEDLDAGPHYTERLQLGPEDERKHDLHVTERFLAFLGIRVDPGKLLPEVWTCEDDRAWARSAVPTSRMNAIRLGIAPGVSSLPKKALPGAWYAEVLRLLPGYRFQLFLFGNEQEKGFCDHVSEVLRRCDNVASVYNYAGQTTVRQMIEALRRCDIVLSQETAVLHLAVALGKRTVGIVGGGHYGRFYPWGDPKTSRVLTKEMDCFHCNWHCRYPSIRCISEIPPQSGAEALCQLL